MAEDNIGGLAAEISGDASRLFSVLQQSELRMREFVSRYGNTSLQIRANIQIPSATAVLDARRAISRQFRDPAAGSLMVPLQMAMPSPTATSTFAKGLVNQIGAISVKVIGNFEWGNRPPGTIPANVVPGGTGAVARPVQPATAIAAGGGPRTIVRKGGPGQRTYYSDGTSAWEPSGGGPVGSGGGFATGGVPIPGGPAGRFGFIPGQANGADLAQQQEDAAVGAALRRQQQAAAQGPRPGQAGGLARAAGAVRDPATGRFLATFQPVARPSTAPPVQATGIPSGPAGDVQRFMDRLARDLPDPEDQALALEKMGWKDQARQVRAAAKQVTQVATGGTAARGSSRILPEERAALLENPQRAFAESQLAAAREEVIAQPTRASSPRVATARLAGVLFGLPEQEVQQRRVTAAANDYAAALKRQDQAQVALNKAEESGKGDIEGLTTKLSDAKEETGQYGKALDDTRVKAEKSNSAIKTFGASFIGGVAGGLAFGTAMQVVSAGFGLVAKAAGPVLEFMTGYIGLSNKLVDSLSDQARVQHGLTSLVVASEFAQAGLGTTVADSIRPYIEQRVAVEAGNKAFQAQFDLIKAGVQLQANPNLGITTGTGGVLGTSLFQTPGTIEQLANLTPRGTLPQQIGANLLPGLATALGGAAGFALGGPVGGVAGVAAGNFIGNTLFPPDKGAQQRADAFKGAITDLADAAKRGAPDVTNMASAVQTANKDLVDQTAQLLLANGASQDWVDALKASNFALTGPSGAIATQQQYQDFFKAAQRGAAITPVADAVKQLTTLTIPARLFQLQATAGLQLQTNQIQFAAQRAAQPFLPFGTTIPGGVAALSPQARALTAGAADFNAQTAIQINNAKVTLSGQLAAFGPQFQQAGIQSFNTLQSLGQQGAGLQAGIISEQVSLATAQFNEQLRLAKLSQSDLLQLTKQEGATRGDNLGLLQRQVIDEQRVSQELSLQSEQLSIQLQQRQLNFQVALAGFTAPGATPQERTARIEEAKIEASFAQKQLDIRKQQVGIAAQVLPIQFKIEDIQFQRSLVSINHQLALISQARQVTIDVAGMTEALNQVNAKIDLAAKDFQTYATAAEGAATGVISDISSLLATYGGKATTWFGAISTAYANAFVSYIQQVTGAINTSIQSFTNPNGPTPPGLGGGGTTPAGGRFGNKPLVAGQQGFLGSVSQPTNFIAGEVAGETVAILKNPRAMSGGMGGMQVVLNISVSGNTVRSDDDLKQLIAEITRGVEQSFSRKLSLLGGRGTAIG